MYTFKNPNIYMGRISRPLYLIRYSSQYRKKNDAEQIGYQVFFSHQKENERKIHTDQQKANTKPKPQRKLCAMCMFHLSEINYASSRKKFMACPSSKVNIHFLDIKNSIELTWIFMVRSACVDDIASLHHKPCNFMLVVLENENSIFMNSVSCVCACVQNIHVNVCGRECARVLNFFLFAAKLILSEKCTSG